MHVSHGIPAPGVGHMMVNMALIVLGLLLWPCQPQMHVQEAADGSVCFNNCHGHGTCVDYTCQCWPGYYGDDCGTAYVKEGERVVPILAAGHFNVTRKNFTSALAKNKYILVGFSAYTCHRCIEMEPEYERIADALAEMKIPFARADADSMKSIALEHSATELPALVLFHKNRPLPYRGVHSVQAVTTYINKHRAAKPYALLKTVEDVDAFFASRDTPAYPLSTAFVVGFFADHEGIEEDEFEDFVEAAEDFRPNEDVYFAAVTSRKTCEWFKKNKTIDRTPSVLLRGEQGAQHAINLNELYGEKGGLKGWVTDNSIPLVGHLKNENFKLYEKIAKPMLMLFLDLTHAHATNNPGRVVGGKSGGLLNEALLVELREVAREFADKVTFVYIDGTRHEDQMRSLGLFGGRERLPSIGFNTRDGLQVPFPEELPINRDTLTQYCADFLSGKLKNARDTEEMAKKAVQASRPINPKNRAARKERKEAPEQVRGVSEQYGDGTKGDRAVVTVTMANFQEVVMDDEKDVVLMLHAKGCEGCAHLAVYYKHMAAAFADQGVTSLVVARMDITDEAPPAELNLVTGPLPLVVMLPAGAKHPPWSFFSGVGKSAQMMKWAAAQATLKFDLPSLPHLNEEQRKEYKRQVREREEVLAKKRRDEARAAKAEEMAQKLYKKKMRRLEQGHAEPEPEPMPEPVDGEEVADEDEEEEEAVALPGSGGRASRRAARRAAAGDDGGGTDEDPDASPSVRRKRSTNVFQQPSPATADENDDEL